VEVPWHLPLATGNSKEFLVFVPLILGNVWERGCGGVPKKFKFFFC